MTNKLNMVQHEEFGKLEILMVDGKPHFPATACAKILGYTNPQKAIRDHCKGVTVSFTPSNGGQQKRNFIPEGDLYRLIIRSKLPAAVQFERWVFDEVLPSIRKHGAYITPELLEKLLGNQEATDSLLRALKDEQSLTDHLARELVDEMERSEHLEVLVGKYEPKAAYYDLIMQSPGAVQVSLIAKDYGMSAAAFNKLLHSLRVQYKIGGTWLLYQTWAGEGYTRSRTYYVGEHTAVIHTCWTQKGRAFLYRFLKEYGILPQSERPLGCRQ